MNHAARPTIAMPLSATDKWLAPAAIPTATAKITNAVSTVSRTTVLNRTMESAPTRLNALATLSPMTCVTIAMRMASRTSVTASDEAVSLSGRVRL